MPSRLRHGLYKKNDCLKNIFIVYSIINLLSIATFQYTFGALECIKDWVTGHSRGACNNSIVHFWSCDIASCAKFSVDVRDRSMELEGKSSSLMKIKKERLSMLL